MERLSELTAAMKNQSGRFTAGRYLHSLHMGKGSPLNSAGYVDSRNWTDRAQIVAAHKAAVEPMTTGDFPSALVPVADSFLSAMRLFSVPLQLVGLRKTPMLTRIFVNLAASVAAEVAEGAAIPVLKGSWDTTILTPRKFAGIVVQTDELLASASPVAALAIADDLAAATAEAENLAFVSPDVAGSVLYGAPTFSGTGASVAAVDADLAALLAVVPGAFRPGAAFVMTGATATFLATLRDASGARAYPDIGPQGGTLLTIPVLVTSAAEQVGSPATRIIGLLSPSEIFWADDGRVTLTVSNEATLKMENNPTELPGNQVSLFQTNATATKAVRESSWYARAGSGAYFTAGF